MTDWYIDPWAGNNNYAGDSWALALSGTDGVTDGTTKFTSASGGFTGKLDRFIRIIATVYKIAAVVSDTEVTLSATIASGSGRSFWLGGPVRQQSYLPTVATFWAAGDRIKFPKTPDSGAVSAGTLTWPAAHGDTVTFASGRAKIVEQCESGWTAAANVTVTHDVYTSAIIQGTYTTKTVVGSAFAGGKVCYKDFGAGSELDLSVFQGLSLMLYGYASAAMTTAHGWRVCLCSDATGDTILEDLAIEWPANLWDSRTPMLAWKPAGNLPASVRSIAIYVTNDPGTPTFFIDNIVAVKSVGSADHLCHRCVLSQGSHLINNLWWGIKNFAGDTTLTLNGEFYAGTGGEVSSYRRQLAPLPVDQTFGYGSTGNAVSPVKISGGWDTSTDVQDGVTAICHWQNTSTKYGLLVINSTTHFTHIENFLLGVNGAGGAVQMTGLQRGMTFDTLVVCGFLAYGSGASAVFGLATTTSYDESYEDWKWLHVRVTATGMYPWVVDGTGAGSYRQYAHNWYFEDVKLYSTRGLTFSNATMFRGKDVEISNCTSGYNANTLNVSGYDWEFNALTLKDNVTYGLEIPYALRDARFYNLVTSGNGTASILVRHSDLRLFNCALAEATKFAEVKRQGRVASLKHGQAADTHLITTFGETISEETSVRHTASGIAWKMQPTHSEQRSVVLKVAELAVGIATYTVSIWLRRDNTGIIGEFYTPGGQVAGVASEVSDSIGANENIWELQSLSLTTTEAGVLEFFVRAQGGTAYTLYVDDFSVA